MQSSRMRQFDELRRSNSNKANIRTMSFGNHRIAKDSMPLNRQASRLQQDNMSVTSSSYICVNCFNHSLSRQRQQARRTQKRKQLEQSRRQAIDYDEIPHLGNRAQEQRRKIRDFNQSQIISKEEKKRRLMEEKRNENRIRKQEQQDFNDKIYRERAHLQLKKQQWKEEIAKQIQAKKAKEQERLKESRGQFIEAQYKEGQLRELRRENEQQYRIDLLKQIRENNKRKMQENSIQKANCLQNALLQEEKEKEKDLQIARQAQLRRQQLLKGQKWQTEELQKRKKLKKEQQKHERAVAEEHIKAIQEEIQVKRHNQEKQFRNYLSEIRKQVDLHSEIRQRQRLERFQVNNSRLAIDDKQIDTKKCNSCEKQYPIVYLTAIFDAADNIEKIAGSQEQQFRQTELAECHKLVRLILLHDGSVTNIIQILAGSSVKLDVLLEQRTTDCVSLANTSLQGSLSNDITSLSNVLVRTVCMAVNQHPMLFARSYWSEPVYKVIMGKNPSTPIGTNMKLQEIETYRNIHWTGEADIAVNDGKYSHLYSRSYTIKGQGMEMCQIEEFFCQDFLELFV